MDSGIAYYKSDDAAVDDHADDPIKNLVTNMVCDMLEYVWAEVKVDYPVGEKTALEMAYKMTTAALVCALKEHYDYLKEDFGPKQVKMEGLG